MKTSALIRIFIYTFIALVLTGVLVWGINGNHNLNFFSFNLFGGSGISYNDAGYSIGGAEVPKDKISEIQVNWTSGNVKVVPYVADAAGMDAIKFHENSGTSLEKDYQMRYKVEDGVLKIQYTKPNLKLKGLFKSLNKDLTISIPAGMTLTDVKIDTVSANIDMESTTADHFDLVTVSGDINGAMLKGNSMEAENVSGEIRWSDGAFQTVTGNSVSGDINTAFATMPRDINLETVSGTITLSLPKNDGFTVDYDKVSGDFNCAFSVQMDKNSAIYKNGINKIKLETVSGDMRILAL